MNCNEDQHSIVSVDNFSVSDNEYEDICGGLLSKLNTKVILQLKTHFTKVKKEYIEDDNIPSNVLRIDEGTFVSALNKILETSKYNLDAMKLFKILDFDETNYVSWETLSDYILEFTKKNSSNFSKLNFNINKSNIMIIDIDHCKKETICSIITIETDDHFCYVIISKYGKVGIYNGKMKLLLEYDVFFIRTGVAKRVRDVWITAAIYLDDIHCLMITASDKSIMIYEASTLCHTFTFLITGITNIPTCLSYIPSNKSNLKSYLVMGDDLGGLTTIVFKQPRVGMLFKKNPDKLTTYFWIELQSTMNEPFCKVKFNRRVHSRPVKKIVHVSKNEKIISCASDSSLSIIIQDTKKIIKPYIFNIPRGVMCFHYSEEINLLATGGSDRRVRLWEPVVTVRPSAIFPLQNNKIIDVVIFAHLNIIMSFNKNGVLVVWNIFNQTCIQSVNINFPSFGVFGRPILFGFQSIYPGPARINFTRSDVQLNSEYESSNRSSVWHRPEIIITCCNHIAIVPLGDGSILDSEVNIKKETDNSENIYFLLPPPEKNHRPKKPSGWDDDQLESEIEQKIEENISELKLTENGEQFSNAFKTFTDEMIFPTVDEILERNGLKDILKKDFLGEFGQKHNMNMKLIMHQPKQEKMRLPISQGAPFTALDLHQHDDIKFTVPLPLSNRMQKKSGLEYFHDPQQIVRYDSCFSMDTPKSEFTLSSNMLNSIANSSLIKEK